MSVQERAVMQQIWAMPTENVAMQRAVTVATVDGCRHVCAKM